MEMNLLKRNVIANFSGNVWIVIMSLAFIPLYIHFIGIEAYGLLGVFATLQALFGLLDMGLSATLSREVARLSVVPNKAHEMRDLVRTLEVIYWGVAVLLGVGVTLLAPLIANHWVQAKNLAPDTIRQAIIIMGIAIAFQWPIGFYSGGLLGLQRQVLFNAVTVGIATLRGAGAVLLLWLVSPTVQAFFVWQVFISASNVLLVYWFLWRSMPRSESAPRWRMDLLRGNLRFAAGMNGITLTVIMLTQTDKVILSRMLSLEMFGYYTLAGAVSGTLCRFYSPVFTALYPRFTQLVALGDQDELKRLYHQGCQVISVLIIPPAIVLALFSREILFLWTQNPITADQAAPLVSLLILGTLFNGFMNLPYALQLAHGWTKLAFYTNILAVLLLVPLMILLVQIYGAVGAALTWMALNAGYVLIAVHVMHRRLLPDEKWRWYIDDIARPFLWCVVAAAVFRGVVAVPTELLMQLIYFFMISVAILGIAAMSTSATRTMMGSMIKDFALSLRC